jgi:hypothetical protein
MRCLGTTEMIHRIHDLTVDQLAELVTRDSMIGTTGAMSRIEWESRK